MKPTHHHSRPSASSPEVTFSLFGRPVSQEEGPGQVGPVVVGPWHKVVGQLFLEYRRLDRGSRAVWRPPPEGQPPPLPQPLPHDSGAGLVFLIVERDIPAVGDLSEVGADLGLEGAFLGGEVEVHGGIKLWGS